MVDDLPAGSVSPTNRNRQSSTSTSGKSRSNRQRRSTGASRFSEKFDDVELQEHQSERTPPPTRGRRVDSLLHDDAFDRKSEISTTEPSPTRTATATATATATNPPWHAVTEDRARDVEDAGDATGSLGLSTGDSQKRRDSDTTPVERKWYHPISLLYLALQNWFLIGIGVVVAIASQYPEVMASGGYIRSEYTIQYGALIIIFLITGLTLSTRALYNQFKSYHLHLFTQIFSLLFFPAVVFAILSIIKAADDPSIDDYLIVGIMVMAILPTTVASNVTMTRGAHGNVEATTAEVVIGQILGIFLSPLILQMFFLNDSWAYGRPLAEEGKTGAAGLAAIYKQVGKRLGLGVFLPTVVGQVIQNIGNAKKYVKWATVHLHLPKVATFMLLTIIWSAFSNQFKEKAFETISAQSVILVVFLNLSLYLVTTIICLYLVRLPWLPKYITDPPDHPAWRRKLSRAIISSRFAKPEATSICFVAPAKGLTVGSPILGILYAGFPEKQRAIISIPIVLYQGQQVAVAQVLTYMFKKWNATPDTLVPDKNAESQATLPTTNDLAYRQQESDSQRDHNLQMAEIRR